MNKKIKSLLAITLVAGFLLPTTIFNNNNKNTKHLNNAITVFTVDPPSMRG